MDTITKYILDGIDGDGYEITPTTPSEKAKFLRDTFLSEYGWRVKQAGEHKALVDWLQGLPSSCSVDFYNYRILELGREWGFLPEKCSERREDNWIEKWWDVIARRIIAMWRREGLL